MLLMSFVVEDRITFGRYDDGYVTDVGGLSGSAPSLRDALTDIAELQRSVESPRCSRYPVEEVSYLPPIPAPGKVIGVGLNYRAHSEEASVSAVSGSEVPPVFARFADSLTGHTGPILIPAVSTSLDWEGELAVVIGRGGRYIGEDDALAHVAGYSCFNDASVRDFQMHTSQWLPGKVFPMTGGFGPWLVTADEAGDLSAAILETRVNDRVMQRAHLSEMIFSVSQLIAYISRFTRLDPGDVICSGTPSGVGYFRQPPVFLNIGDKVEVEVTKVGCLTNHVEEDALGPVG